MNTFRLAQPALPQRPTQDEGVSNGVTHFLAVPDFVDPDDMEFLFQCKEPRASWEVRPILTELEGNVVDVEPGVLRLSPRSVLRGPYASRVLPTDVAESGASLDVELGSLRPHPLSVPHPAQFPATTQVVWALETLRERGEAPWPGAGDRDGINRVFAQGLPVREELRQVLAAVAVARYLEGCVVFDAGESEPSRTYHPGADTHRYRTVTPDPAANVDLVIYSDVWLDPMAALGHGQLALPDLRFMPNEVEWDGPVDSGAYVARDVGFLDGEQVSQLHADADETDLDALRGMQPLSTYSMFYEGTDGDLIVVEVGGSDELPGALAAAHWAQEGVVEYAIRWVPRDLEDWQRETPSFELRRQQTKMASLVRAVARSLVVATSGEVADQDGFLLDPSAL